MANRCHSNRLRNGFQNGLVVPSRFAKTLKAESLILYNNGRNMICVRGESRFRRAGFWKFVIAQKQLTPRVVIVLVAYEFLLYPTLFTRSQLVYISLNDEPKTLTTAPFTKTLLLILLILNTSCNLFELSPNSRIWSPGTTFQYLILSFGFTDLMTGSRTVNRFIHFLGKGSKCRKLVVHGEEVAPRISWSRV